MQSVAKSGSRLIYITTLHKGTESYRNMDESQMWCKNDTPKHVHILYNIYIYIYMYIQNIACKGNCKYIVPMLCQKVFNVLLLYMHKCIGFEHCVVVAHK